MKRKFEILQAGSYFYIEEEISYRPFMSLWFQKPTKIKQKLYETRYYDNETLQPIKTENMSKDELDLFLEQESMGFFDYSSYTVELRFTSVEEAMKYLNDNYKDRQVIKTVEI